MKDYTCLIRIKGADGERTHIVQESSFTLGRTQEADLPITDSSVSRVHLGVVFKDDHVWISDQKSANGTFLNDQRLTPGESVAVTPDDVIRLGTMQAEFRFLAMARPFEMMNLDQQKTVLMAAMDDISKQIEKKAREKVEEDTRQARMGVEQLLSQAKRDVEVIKTRELLDLQTQKQTLEIEIESLRRSAKAVASEEKMHARKEADHMVAEAQKRIQADYQEANERMETQVKGVQARSLKIIEDAESKAEKMLGESRAEAAHLRTTSSEEARVLLNDARKRSAETLSGMQERLQAELQETKETLLAQAREEANRERERVLHEADSQITTLRQQADAIEAEKHKHQAACAEAQKQLAGLLNESKAQREDVARAQDLLAKVTDLEARRDTAKRELNEFLDSRDSGKAKLEDEFKDLRDRALLERTRMTKEHEEDIAKARLHALEEIKSLVKAEEQRFMQAKRLRALELKEKLQKNLLPHLDKWVAEPMQAPVSIKAGIETAVDQVFLGEESSIRLTQASPVSVEEQKTKRRKINRGAVAACAALVIVASIYHSAIFSFLERLQGESAAGRIIEARRIQSVYTPVQTDAFRDTYWENVLYMRNYLDTKTDQLVNEKWTLRLNDIGFLRPMGLSEEDIVMFVAKETNLVQRLAAMKGSVDAVYLEEGLSRLREAEKEDVDEMKKLLKGDANYQQIRMAEKEFITAMLASKKLPTAK